MAISFVTSVTSFTNPAFPVGDQWTFVVPGSAQSGDVVLLVIGSTVNVSSGCHVITAGWSTTLLFRGDDNDLVIVAAYVLTGTEISPITVSFTDDFNTDEAIPVALFYRGASLPIAGSGASAVASPPNYTSPSQTPLVVGDWYVGIAHVNTNASTIDSTPGEQRFDLEINDDALAVFDLVSTSIFPFGPQTSISSTGPEGSAHSLILPVQTGIMLSNRSVDVSVSLPSDVRVIVTIPTAINTCLIAAENITDNLRAQQPSDLELPSLYKRAFLVAYETDEIALVRK